MDGGGPGDGHPQPGPDAAVLHRLVPEGRRGALRVRPRGAAAVRARERDEQERGHLHPLPLPLLALIR